MLALYLKEIRSFLSSVIGYIFIAIFLILNSLFLWVISSDTNILEGEQADLIPFFYISPYIFLILIPAITMRSFSEEKRTGTIELLFTKPLSDNAIILAKYLAGVTLVFISLVPTLVYYYTVHRLGNPVGIMDDGATIGSYFGLMFIGACFVAFGIFASSITSSQIIAFIISVFLCWFLYDGLNMLGSFQLMGDMDYVIKKFGMFDHYEAIKKGVVDTRDLIYFLSLILVFMAATKLVVQSRKW